MDPVDVVVVGLLLTVIVVGSGLYFALSYNVGTPAELNWIVAPTDDEFFKPDNDQLVKESLTKFVDRVAGIVEQKTGCQTAPDRDLIRVYKNNKLVGIVKCCELGRNVSPAIVRELVELAQHLKVKTCYLATLGPMPSDTQTFAKLQKVKLISL